MKLTCLLILIIPVTVFGQSVGNKTFKQDLAVMHTAKLGFTDLGIKSVIVENETPVAFLDDFQMKWNGNAWENFSGKKAEETSYLPDLPVDKGEVLISVEYDDGYAIGTEKGLYFYVFSSNADPFEPQKFYSSMGVLAELKFERNLADDKMPLV